MVEHIVLFKWNEATTPDILTTILAALRELPSKIDGIVDLTCGDNFSNRSQGFTHGLVVRFADRAALDAYGPHPEHQAVVQNLIRPNVAETVVVDFETGS